ncbi:uncharacterized protein LOC107800463 [Nicotiana tabacum]|uniref:Uncharacterized protein LOC107800463 n=1 Tax=Nicotiana tabacum TaxID=4097 RepID=A0A1S4AQT8_TOBAC
MGNTEKRKRKRINTGTRRKSTRTKRRTRTGIKRKAASLRRLELPLYLGLLLEGNFTREMNIKIDTLAQIKGEMNISSEIGIETSALRKASAPISFTSSLASAVETSKHPDQFHIQLGLSAVETEDSKFVQELDRRIRDAEKGAQSQLAERFPVECKRDEETGRVRIKDSGNLAQHKEKNKEKGFVNNKMDGQAFRGELKIGANAIPPSLSTMAKSKFEGIPRPLEENVEKSREEKQKPKERRDDKPREKNKDKDREKKSHGKQKDKEKEKKKEEKAKGKSEHKKSQEDTSRDINKNDFVGLTNNKLPLISKESIAGTVNVGINRKRKDVETNGFLHESELRPAKLLRPSSSQQPTQNGKTFDTHPKADLFSSSKQEVATDVKVENKKHKVNGGIEGLPLFSAEAKASSIIPGADQIAEASKRSPHPDSKFLSQILAVPKVDDWSGFDDQEWLLGSKRTPAKKAETCPDEVNKEHWVWSEALQIEAADVCALPYVIPY